MDFFEAQDRARRLSHRLVLLFGLAVVCMIAIVYLTALVALGLAPVADVAGVASARSGDGWVILHPELLLAVALGMGAVIGGGAAFRTAQLARGGPAVAELLGGRRVDPATDDADERVLLNVVEEMSIAAGLPVPAVYVLDREQGINAFAAGHTTDDAAVAVTRGTLEGLSRDELQGVVAHEFSHILNGDMRLNVRLMGLLFGILLLSVVGRGLLRGSMMGGGRRGRGGRGTGAQVLMGLVLLMLGYLGVVFGRLIQASVSRQREFLADAAAVQFTRNPDGLAGALKRIGAASAGSVLHDHHAQEASHLFFARGTARALSRLTSTHPPLAERIRRIDPRWDGSFKVAPRPRRVARPGEGRAAVPSGPRPPGAVPFPAAAMATAGAAAPGALLATAGTPDGRHVAHVRSLLEGVPAPLREAVRTPEGAVAAVVALVLAADPGAGASQREQVAEALGERTAGQALQLRETVAALGPAGRLPLLDLALASLRELPPERASALRRTAGDLIRAQGSVRTFDFALYHVLRRALPAAPARGPERRRPGTTPLTRLGREAETLLSAVARAGSGPEPEIVAAFEAGAALLPGEGARWSLQPPEALGLDRVDEALGRMESAAPRARRAFLEAAAAAALADRRVEVREVEMLRAVAAALDVPLPPFAEGIG